MGWRKWRSSPSLNHQADLGKHVDPRASRMGVGGPLYGTLRKGECSCILCSFAPNPTSSHSSHSSKKSTQGTFPRSIRFPRIPPSLLKSSPSLLSGSNSTSFFSSPRSSTLSSFPSSPCLRYIKKRGKSRARLDMSSERGKSEKIVERGKRVDGGRGLGGRVGLRGEDGGRGLGGGRMGLGVKEVQEGGPRRWHSLQSLLCHTRWDNPIYSPLLKLTIAFFAIYCPRLHSLSNYRIFASFSCPGSSIPDLGQLVSESLTATLEFQHKE